MARAGLHDPLSSPSQARARMHEEALPVEPIDPDEVLRHGLNIARRTLMRYGACRIEDAEDHAQEIAMSFVVRRDSIVRPEAWFYYRAFYRAVETRAAARGRTIPLHETDLHTEINEEKLDCQRKFLALGDRCRRLLSFIFVEELTLRETAVRVKRTLKDVFLLKQRCLKSLHDRLIGPPVDKADA